MNQVVFEDEIVTPCKIVCVGRNYVEHIKELGNEIPEEMVLFLKPNSSISDDLYFVGDDNHYEGEISFLIKEGKIYGVGFGLDLTKRDLQSKLKSKGLPWERAKAFDKAAVFSKFVKIDELEVERVGMKLFINDKLSQEGGVELMIYKPNTILKEVKSFMSLDDFDIIMSGTPKGVGNYRRGDNFLAEIYVGEKLLISQKWIAK